MSKQKIDQAIEPFSKIEKECDGEWVLLTDYKMDKQQNITKGKLRYHHKERKKVYQFALKKKLNKVAVFYVGKRPNIPVAFNL